MRYDWISLLDISGPFLPPGLLDEVFPQGLDGVSGPSRRLLLDAYAAWQAEAEAQTAKAEKLRQSFLQAAMDGFLGWDSGVAAAAPPAAAATADWSWQTSSEDGVGRFAADGVLHARDHSNDVRLCWKVVPAGGKGFARHDPDSADGWTDSVLDKMERLCKVRGVRLGLVTDGETWTLVHVPAATGATTLVSWSAALFRGEPETLRAFLTFLGVRRFFGAAEGETLPELFERAVGAQAMVAETLGGQVREAVEVFVQTLNVLDEESGGQLLAGVTTAEAYEGVLTLMMRLVFLLFAEQNDLLLLGKAPGVYDDGYAISPLLARLEKEEGELGADVLGRRFDAYARLLATTRAVYGGACHPDLRLPPLGGSLFDPDRYPFLEGRRPGTRYRETPAAPPQVDNRTVLLMLQSLQRLRQGGDSLLLNYKALDVEQIGYVYEGLLERTVARTTQPMVGLKGTAAAGADIALSALETVRAADGDDGVTKLLAGDKGLTGRTPNLVRRDLAAGTGGDPAREAALLRACGGDEALAARVRPFAGLLREDRWGRPMVWRAGALKVAGSSDRSSTGTYYTPRALTGPVVERALEPAVYAGPAEGWPRERWRLKSPAEILALKVLDPAMGSGAFLVQAARYLGQKLTEAWAEAERAGQAVYADGTVGDPAGSGELMLAQDEARKLEAGRLIVEKCLYGVDVNPMAVELAKLSLWLVTVQRDRPFAYLDHNLRSGDSLLGVADLRDLKELRLAHDGSPHAYLTFGVKVDEAIATALSARSQLRATPDRDITGIDRMKRLDKSARKALDKAEVLADLFAGTLLREASRPRRLGDGLALLAVSAADLMQGLMPPAPVQGSLDLEGAGVARQGHLGFATFTRDYAAEAQDLLDTGLPPGSSHRRPFHWALEFPEVFNAGGFDAIIGNPPFLGGQKLTGTFGVSYRDYLVAHLADGRRGSADLVAYFYLRAYALLKPGGIFSLIATNTIAEGDTRRVALEHMVAHSAQIIAAHPNQPWPGTAALSISPIAVRKPAIASGDNEDGLWHGPFLLGSFEAPEAVPAISPFLSGHEEWTPQVLDANKGQSFQGSIILGLGFTMSEAEAHTVIERNPDNAEVLFPYLNGEDLNSSPEQAPSRWVINFFDWPLDRSASGSWENASPREQANYLKAGHVPADYPARVAADFPDLLAIVETQVRPERLQNRDRTAREKWWNFLRPRGELYHAIGRGEPFAKHPADWNGDIQREKVLVCSEVSKYLIFFKVVNQPVFTANLDVFSQQENYPVLLSNIHEVWGRKYSSKLELRLKYSPGNAYETFPFPKPLPEELGPLGEAFDTLRKSIMQREGIGLTALYNAFHDSSSSVRDIEQMRSMQKQIDEAVARAYGWEDIALGHEFHEVEGLGADNVRFTVSATARSELLSRLGRLNLERYQEEQAT